MVSSKFPRVLEQHAVVVNSTPSFQPSLAIGYKGFSATSWFNFSWEPESLGQNWTEYDLTLDYSHSFGKLGISGGYILYVYPGLPEGPSHRTQEFYAGVSGDVFLKPSFTFYHDINDGSGNYLFFSGSHSQELGKRVVLNLGFGAGVNNRQGIAITTISDVDLSASLDIPVGRITLSPFFIQMIGNRGLFGSHNAFGAKLTLLSF